MRTVVGQYFRNFDLSVSLGQLRSIQISIVGMARRPGSYTIGSFSTLANGGPAPNGSLRHIQLRRSGHVRQRTSTAPLPCVIGAFWGWWYWRNRTSLREMEMALVNLW